MSKADEIRENVNKALNGYLVLGAEARALREVAVAIGVLADTINEPVKPFHVVHKDESSIYPNNFVIDWDAGYQAACDDIRDFCIEKQHEIVREIENPDTWNKGFLAGLLCVQKGIQEEFHNE